MPTSVACPNCGRAFQVPSELLDKRLRCLECQRVFTARSSSQPAASLQTERTPARQTRDSDWDEEPSSPRIDQRRRPEDHGVPGYLWLFAAFPWCLLLLALGGCFWGLLAGIAAVALSAGGITLVQVRRWPVGARLAGLLALDGVAMLIMMVGGIFALVSFLNSAGEQGQDNRANSAVPRDQQRRAQTPALPAAPDVPLPQAQQLFNRGPRVFVADMLEFGVKDGHPWPFGKNGKVGDGRAIRVNGVLSPKGLSMHPPWAPEFASARYRLGKQAAVFRATVAINETSNWCWSPATFTVLGDGKVLWQSAWIAHNHAHEQKCSVDVSGVDVLELRVHCVNGSDGVHAVWLEPRLLQKADTPDG